MKNTSISRLDELFYPDSIAIVGLPRTMKSGSIFLMGLKDQGFRGKLYPVHPVAEQIDGIRADPSISAIPGHVGVVSHSGSLANILGRVAVRRGIRFSKVASLGNEADLDSTDFLAYLGQDSKTRVVGAYLENVKRGPTFLRTLQEACRKKPVILWKSGLTPEGSRAAASHTGALAGSWEVWEGVVRQAGAVPVVGFEAWVDALAGFSLLPERWGDRMAVVSGPGGLAVGAADACSREGLRLADLLPETCSALAEILPPTGTSLRNPIDVGFTGALDMAVYDRVTRIAAEDPGVDALLIIGHGLTPESSAQYLRFMIEARRESGKPFLMVDIPGLKPDLSEDFGRAGIPFFETAERALATYALFRRYHLGRSGISASASGR